MTRNEILDKVSENLAEMFELDPETIRPEAHLAEDLGLDSIDAIDMTAKMQELTGQRLAREDLQSIRTVGDVVDIIDKMTSAETRQSG